MSFLATLLISWAAVHLFVAGSYLFVFYRQRHGGEYLSFALLSIALAVGALSSAFVIEAPTPHAASHAQELKMLALVTGLPAFLAFVSHVVGYRPAWRWAWALPFSAFATAAILSGICFDPGEPLPPTPPLFAFVPYTHEVVTQPAGVAIYLAAAGTGAGFLFEMRRAMPGSAEMRALAVIGAVAVPPLFFDTFARAMQVRTFYLFEPALVVATILTSYLLMRRFIRAGDELERKTLDLRHSYDDLRHVQEELVRKEQLAAVGELSAVIAHEVRNPLAVLKNAVSGLRRAELRDEDRAALFGILDEETDRLNRLVRDLLSYARPVEPQSTPLPLEATLRHAIDVACRGRARASNVDFALELEGVPESIDGDKDLIERAFVSIVENALEAMPNGGRLVIRASPDTSGEPMVRLAFCDTGEGMDTLVRSRARDPFFTTRSSGIGLGLAIVERVIMAHGGTVELAKNEDAGSTVTVRLPVRRRQSLVP